MPVTTRSKSRLTERNRDNMSLDTTHVEGVGSEKPELTGDPLYDRLMNLPFFKNASEKEQMDWYMKEQEKADKEKDREYELRRMKI